MEMNDDDQDIKEKELPIAQSQEPIALPQLPATPSSSSPSEFHQQYLECLGNFTFDPETIRKSLASLFQTQRVRYNPEHFVQSLRARTLEQNPDGRIVDLRVEIGHFRISLKVRLEQSQSLAHECRCKCSSKDSLVYLVLSNSQKVAVKCYPWSEPKEASPAFARALKQCCFLKIASGLGVGPEFLQPSGFDLILYDSCCEFAIEFCRPVQEEVFKPEEAEMLKRKLKLLHYFQIIHLDVKPDNIMFSPAKEEMVFIDYGFSRLTSALPGYKSFTNFTGSLNYCSEPMKRLFSDKGSTAEVDLYYNDANALNISIAEMGKARQIETIQVQEGNLLDIEPQNEINSCNYLNFCMKCKLIWFIHAGFITELQKNKYSSYLRHFSQELLETVNIYPYSRILEDIHNIILQHSKKETTTHFENKKERLFQGWGHEGNPYDCLRSKLSSDNNSFLDFFQSEGRVQLIIGENWKERLSLISEVKKMTKTQYFYRFLQVVDIRSPKSTFKQKVDLANVLRQSEGYPDRQTESVFPQLEAALTYILQFYLDHQGEYFEWVIPSSIVNLVIFQALSLQQLQEILSRIGQLEGNRIKLKLMMFRCSLIQDWIDCKILSRYQNSTVMELIFKTTSQDGFNHQKQRQIASGKNISPRQFMMESTLHSFVDFFSKELEAIQPKEIQELQGVFAFFRSQVKHSVQVMSHINTLLDFNNIFFRNDNSIDFYHLKTLQRGKYLSSETVYSTIEQTVRKCLQDFRIIKNFKFFYGPQSAFFQNESLENRRQELLAACEVKEYKYCEAVIDQCNRLVLESQQISSGERRALLTKMRRFFDHQYLKQLPFPSRKQGKFDVFFSKVFSVISFISSLYQENSSEMGYLTQLMEELWNLQETIPCIDCKKIAYHNLKKSQLVWLGTHKEHEKILLICKEQIEKTSQERQSKNILIYLYFAIDVLQHLDSQQCQEQIKIIYAVFRDQDILGSLFLSEPGHLVFRYLSTYTLQQGVEHYLWLHRQLLLVIKECPCKDFINFYSTHTVAFIFENMLVMMEHAKQLVEGYLQGEHQSNPYDCLFLCFLTKLLQRHSALWWKSINKIFTCFIERVTNSARIIVEEDLLYYLIFSTKVVSEGRQRRSKTFSNGSHLRVISCKFKEFLSRLQLTHLTKSHPLRSKLKREMLVSKVKQFYSMVQLHK